MKNKKFLIILSLIIGLTIPSYSAVSVSDGSAFITKNESDAAFNNLQSRMSIFENAIDAKIDSLVSSYLSRNGIWNGSKQTLTTTGTLAQVGVERNTEIANQTYMYYSYPYYNETTAISNWTNVPLQDTLFFSMGNHTTYYLLKTTSADLRNYTLVEKTTKPGLMHIMYDVQFSNTSAWSQTSSLSQDSQICCCIRQGSYSGSNGMVKGVDVSLILGADFILYEYLNGSSDGSILYTDNRMQVIPSPAKVPAYAIYNISAYMFVSKNSTIKCSILNKSSVSNLGLLNAQFLKFMYRVTSCKIY